VRFSIQGAGQEAEVLFEANRAISAADGTFADEFAPYQVHVYRAKGH